jgi:hypothetical protein
MSDQALRALMQRVQNMRHRDERLDNAGVDWPKEGQELAAEVARQWRLLAEQRGVLRGREFEAATPLRWSPLWVTDPEDLDVPPTEA